MYKRQGHPNGCDAPCELTGAEVLHALRLPTARNKWVDLSVLVIMAVAYRLLFWTVLKVREVLAK